MNTTKLENRRAAALKAWKALEENERPVLLVGTGSCGRAAGNDNAVLMIAGDDVASADGYAADYSAGSLQEHAIPDVPQVRLADHVDPNKIAQ